MLKLNCWNEASDVYASTWVATDPIVSYQRIYAPSMALEFDFDRLVKTDVGKLMRICKQQTWVKNFGNKAG